MILFSTIFVFLRILEILVIADVILSWLSLFGVRFRPRFLGDILNPIYRFVRHYIPSRIGAFDFTPIVIIFSIYIIAGLLITLFPEQYAQIPKL